MRLLGSGAATLAALLVAVFVIGDVAVSAAGLWNGAGWYALVAIAFPLFMLFAVKRGWGDGPGY